MPSTARRLRPAAVTTARPGCANTGRAVTTPRSSATSTATASKRSRSSLTTRETSLLFWLRLRGEGRLRSERRRLPGRHGLREWRCRCRWRLNSQVAALASGGLFGKAPVRPGGRVLGVIGERVGDRVAGLLHQRREFLHPHVRGLVLRGDL